MIYGDTSRLSANQFFYGLRHGDEHRIQIDRGVELIIGLEAISEADERGMRTVMCIIIGNCGRSWCATAALRPTSPPPRRPTAPTPTTWPPRSPASSPSTWQTAKSVTAGQTIATIEAMKMEAAITAPKAGTVSRVAVRRPPRSKAVTS